MNPDTERLRAEDWCVRPIGISTARYLVETEHYAKGASNTAVYLHGLFRKGDLFDAQCRGVAWWLPPTKSAGLATYPAGLGQKVLCLSRLVVTPDVPRNGATFLLSRSRKMIDAEAWECLVTYADAWRGHTGAIYRADNWDYVGLTKPQPVYCLDGRMVCRKAGPKTRTHEEMLALGSELVGHFPKHKFVRMLKGDRATTSEAPIKPLFATKNLFDESLEEA